jgi:NTE family protein
MGCSKSKHIEPNSKVMVKPRSTSLHIENLVFEGGGVKGIAYTGALERLNELDLLKNVKRYAGSSAGSIIATLLAVGYTTKELKNIMVKIDFPALLDDKIGVLRDAYAIMSKYGYCDGAIFTTIMEKYIGKKDYTFKQLWDDRGIELVIVGTNLNRMQEVHFSYKTYGDMPIVKAVRISMSIPLIFKPIKMEADYYVDGGVTNNYPLTVFDDKNTYNDKTIGIKFHTADKEEPLEIYKGRRNIESVIGYIQTLIDTVSISNEHAAINDNYKKRSIVIDTGKISSTDFDLSAKEKYFLIEQGRIGVDKFINS